MKKRLEKLHAEVSDLQNCLILVHNNPDPDAIASAVALRFLLQQLLGLETKIAYQGIIGRAENKTLVRYLENPLKRLSRLKSDKTTQYALVDTQPGAGNNPLPPTDHLVIVFDHHPLREMTKTARFADVRPEVGATSSILTGYLKATGCDIPPPLATALFYGIKTDTMGLGRGTHQLDMMAICYLLPRIDPEALFQIEHAQVPVSYFRRLGEAFNNTWLYDHVIISFLGEMDYPDLTAETADMFLRVKGSRWVICMGSYQDEFILSIRTHNKRGAGVLAQQLVGSKGVAGGHSSMAGGLIPLNSDSPAELAKQITAQTLSHLKVQPDVEGKVLTELAAK